MHESIKVKGVISIYTYKGGTHDKAAPFISRWKKCVAKGDFKQADHYKRKFEKIFKDNQIGEPNVTNNLVMTAPNLGRDLIIQRLMGINTYSLNLSYAEIGTGNTAPTATDTTITAAVARASLSAGVAQDLGNNQAQIQYFFADATLTNVTYYEGGTYVDGNASLGTGQLWNHALLTSPYTKAPGTDITLQLNASFT